MLALGARVGARVGSAGPLPRALESLQSRALQIRASAEAVLASVAPEARAEFFRMKRRSFAPAAAAAAAAASPGRARAAASPPAGPEACLLYTSDAADE